MAQRYVPMYFQSPYQGWYGPRMAPAGPAWSRFPLQPSVAQPAAQNLQPADQPISDELLQQIKKITDEIQSAQQENTTGSVPTGSTTADSATITKSNVETLKGTKKFEKTTKKKDPRLFRYSGMILCTIASAIISLGVSNIVVTALTVMTPAGSLGCFGTGNSMYETLGPRTEVMKALDWSWISVGLWATILVYVVGNLAGSITTLDSARSRAFATLSLVSLFVLIPGCLVLSILDVVLSKDCNSVNPTKFGTPIAIVILCAIEFATLMYILIRFRKEAKKALDTPQSNQPAMEMSTIEPTRPSFAGPITRYTGGNMKPQPNITVINVQPPKKETQLPAEAPVLPPPGFFRFRSIPPPVLVKPYYQPPMARWHPRRPDLNRPARANVPNLYGARQRNQNMGLFNSRLFPSMAYGNYPPNSR